MIVNPIVVALLRSPARTLLDGSVLALRITGRRTGKLRVVPVQFAREGDRIVVYPGGFRRKTWWRNLEKRVPVDVLIEGRWQPAVAVAMPPGSESHASASAAYARRWPGVRLDPDAPMVVVTLGAARS